MTGRDSAGTNKTAALLRLTGLKGNTAGCGISRAGRTDAVCFCSFPVLYYRKQQTEKEHAMKTEFTVEGMGNAEEAAAYVAETMYGSQYLDTKEGAWEALLDYAAEMK